MMISSTAIMGLQPALDCWGNRCRRPLRCPHQFPPVCVWPSREGVFMVFFRDAEVLVPQFGRPHFVNRVHDVEVTPRLG